MVTMVAMFAMVAIVTCEMIGLDWATWVCDHVYSDHVY